jgi:trigger factor
MAREWAKAEKRERKFTVMVSAAGDCKRVLSIEIPQDEVEREEALITEQLRRDLKVPGFRKGRVPLKYVEKNYSGVIHRDAVQNLLPHVYEDALVREGIMPVGQPKFENLSSKKGENVTVDVVVEIRPDLEIKHYRGVKVEVKRGAIGEKEVTEALNHLRERMSTFKLVDREARENDFVIIDYGPILESGEVEAKSMIRNYPVDLSSPNILEEFREGLAGMSIKEEKDIRASYPEDFPDESLAGKERRLRVTVKEIKERHLPELDDAFAKRVGEQFSGMEALREKIKQDMENDEEKRFEHEIEERVIDNIIATQPFEVPEAMIENYLASIIDEDRRRRPNVPDDDEREREIRENYRNAAVRTIRKYFILDAIKVQENIELQEGDLEAKIEELAKGAPEKEEDVRAYFRRPEQRRSLENQMLDEKILKFVRENADIKEKR